MYIIIVAVLFSEQSFSLTINQYKYQHKLNFSETNMVYQRLFLTLAVLGGIRWWSTYLVDSSHVLGVGMHFVEKYATSNPGSLTCASLALLSAFYWQATPDGEGRYPTRVWEVVVSLGVEMPHGHAHTTLLVVATHNAGREGRTRIAWLHGS
jgi:hypothetical protein